MPQGTLSDWTGDDETSGTQIANEEGRQSPPSDTISDRNDLPPSDQDTCDLRTNTELNADKSGVSSNRQLDEIYFVENVPEGKRDPYWLQKPKMDDDWAVGAGSGDDESDSESGDNEEEASEASEEGTRPADFIHLRCVSKAHKDVSWRISVKADDIDSQGVPSHLTIAAIHKLDPEQSKKGASRTTWSTMNTSLNSKDSIKGSELEYNFGSHIRSIQTYILGCADYAEKRKQMGKSLRGDERSAPLTGEMREAFDQTTGFRPDWKTVCRALQAESQRRQASNGQATA